jgi:hypothetical protein
LDDEAAYMELATSNAQGELSPLEIGLHALQFVLPEKRIDPMTPIPDLITKLNSMVEEHEALASMLAMDAVGTNVPRGAGGQLLTLDGASTRGR